MEKQIQSDIIFLNQVRKEILNKEKEKTDILENLKKLENSEIKDITYLKFLREYQKFLNEKIRQIEVETLILIEKENKILDSIKEKNAQKKAIENYLYRKSLQQEVKKQFEEAIQSQNNYNRNFISSII